MDIKVELFREYYLFSREDILKSLELFIAQEKSSDVNQGLRFQNHSNKCK